MVAAPRGALSGFPTVTVTDAPSTTAPPAGAMARLRSMLDGSGEASLTKRLAGTIFIIRVISAALAYLSQILLARWMGGSDYGVYVYVWTWVLLLGSMMDFGTAASAQKIIPEYRTRGEQALLRGFLSGSRWMTFAVSSAVALLLAGVVKLVSPWLDSETVLPLYIGCLTLPAFVVANTQDGIARSYDWMRLGLMPQFIVRQALIIGFTAGAFVLGFRLGATAAMLASAAAVWIAMIGQMTLLNRRLRGQVEPGAKAHDYRGTIDSRWHYDERRWRSKAQRHGPARRPGVDACTTERQRARSTSRRIRASTGPPCGAGMVRSSRQGARFETLLTLPETVS